MWKKDCVLPTWAPLLGRLFIAPLFILAGLGKIMGFAGSVAYAASAGVPLAEVAIVLSIIIEVGGGLLILFGWKTRHVAMKLAMYVVLLALIFHRDFSDQLQMSLFLKNFAIAGGLLFLSMHGPGSHSCDDKEAAKGKAEESSAPAMESSRDSDSK